MNVNLTGEWQPPTSPHLRILVKFAECEEAAFISDGPASSLHMQDIKSLFKINVYFRLSDF